MRPVLKYIGISENKLVHFKKVDTYFLNEPFHFHPNCELVCIEEGYGKLIVGDSVSSFNEGTFVLLGPEIPHIFISDDAFYKGNKKLRSKATVIYFSPSLLSQYLTTKDLQPLTYLINNALRGLEIIGNTRNVIRKEMSTIMEKGAFSQLISLFRILEILTTTDEVHPLSSKNFINTFTVKDTERINVVYHFILQNFKHDIRIEKVAGIAHMVPTAFSRFFRQRTGKTFSEFIKELRIQHACELLDNSRMSIREISYECGYNNPTNFNKFFKEITTVNPREWRKNHK